MTVVGEIDRLFDNLSGSHHPRGIYVSGQLSRDVIGCFKSNYWLAVMLLAVKTDWSSLVWFVRFVLFVVN